MTEGQRILNRAWNHLWLDSEDTRQLGLENIELMRCYRLAGHWPDEQRDEPKIYLDQVSNWVNGRTL